MKKITVLVEDTLYLKLKVLSTIKHQAVTDIAVQAIEQYLKQYEPEIKQKLSEVMK